MSPSTDMLTGSTEQLGLRLAGELRRRWQSGEQIPAEQLLVQHPELSQHPEAAIELIYEEYCQREAAGQKGVEQDLVRRFPQWASQLAVMLDCHRRVIEADLSQPRFPGVGERLGDFKLVKELARGSRGRVFLAAQTALGDRPVVLKITPLDGSEHVSLARLQHTNIVPLYSVLDDLERGIRVLCMPYFGRATLASLLTDLANVPPASRRGCDIVKTIDRMQDLSCSEIVSASAARQMLASVSFVQAICWITACLADALQFAHERGLVHLDLKPSNILLATDGQPMLLDFHLAREPTHPGRPAPESFGGTPPYMPPEQLSAIGSLRDGKPVAVGVDGRADVFALGAILYESLGGRLPLSTQTTPLARVNSQVSTGLSDILHKCVADRAEARYPDAYSLAEDLRRHLTDQPLAGVANRSLGERWHKWRRRRPAALRTMVMLLVVAAALAIVVSGAALHLHDRHEQSRLALLTAQRQMSRAGERAEAVKTLERALDLLAYSPFAKDLRQTIRSELAQARSLDLAEQLSRLADDVRLTYGSTEVMVPERRRALVAQCSTLWQKRDMVLRTIATADDTQVRADLLDLAVFAASLQVDPEGESDSVEQQGHREALHILDQARAALGSSAVLEHESRIHHRALGLPESVISPPPHTAWEHCMLGRALLRSGELARASQELAAAVSLEPAARWPNFYAGVCAHRMGRYQDAVTSFSVCIGSGPDVAGYYYNRAMSYTALGRIELALGDYNRALQIEPGHAAAALNRGVVHFQHGRLAEARADLQRAFEHGADAAAVHFNLALVYRADHAHTLALHHARQALEHDPGHEGSRLLRESLQRLPD
jgi:serine/threonine protein kinase/Flp pilus assembly protein TadD